MNVDTLLAWIEEDFSGPDLEQAKAVAKDLADLYAQKIAGEDVAEEIDHAKAAAANLSVVAAEKVRQTFLEWTGELAKNLLAVIV